MNVPPNSTDNPGSVQREPKPDQAVEPLGEGHITGNLTRDPELRFTSSGRAVARMSVAYTPRIKDDATGEWSDGQTEFYVVNVWGRQAEHCAENLAKGDRIVAAGSWARRRWQTDDGEGRESIELTARDLGPSMLFAPARVIRARRQPSNNGDDSR